MVAAAVAPALSPRDAWNLGMNGACTPEPLTLGEG